jgi:hypothetical protein
MAIKTGHKFRATVESHPGHRLLGLCLLALLLDAVGGQVKRQDEAEVKGLSELAISATIHGDGEPRQRHSMLLDEHVVFDHTKSADGQGKAGFRH